MNIAITQQASESHWGLSCKFYHNPFMPTNSVTSCELKTLPRYTETIDVGIMYVTVFSLCLFVFFLEVFDGPRMGRSLTQALTQSSRSWKN